MNLCMYYEAWLKLNKILNCNIFNDYELETSVSIELLQWKTKGPVLKEQSSVILRTLQEGTSASEAQGQSLPDLKDCTEKLYYQLERSFDQEDGGFSKEPKFPQPGLWSFKLFFINICMKQSAYSNLNFLKWLISIN